MNAAWATMKIDLTEGLYRYHTRKKKSIQVIMSSVTYTDLPTEMDPRSWNMTDRSAACSSKIPINTAFDSLNACYKTGKDLDSCANSTGYRDTFLNYQNCLAGGDGEMEDETCQDEVAFSSSPIVAKPVSSTGESKASSESNNSPSQISWIPMSVESLITFLCGMVNTVMLTVVVYLILRRRTSS